MGLELVLFDYTVKMKVRMRFWLRVMVARLAPPTAVAF